MCKTLKESKKDTREQGRKEGIQEGIEQGELLLGALMRKLLSKGRVEDVWLAAIDKTARNRLYKEYDMDTIYDEIDAHMRMEDIKSCMKYTFNPETGEEEGDMVKALEESKQDVRKQGRNEGIKEGRKQGEWRLSTLMQKLLSESRIEEAWLATSNKAERNRLYKKYSIAQIYDEIDTYIDRDSKSHQKYILNPETGEEADMCKALNEIKKSAERQGMAEGIEQGIAEGKEQGEARMGALILKLLSDDRIEDAWLASTDKAARNRLYQECGIASV